MKKISRSPSVLAVILLIAAFFWMGGPSWVSATQERAVSGSPAPTSAASDRDIERAKKQLRGLKVAKAGSMAGYDRKKSFPHWRDPDRNGCDAREDALIKAGKNVKTGKGCKIISGRWVDPYGGYTTTNARSLDVDHIVPLANAWRSGANSWSKEKSERFANDQINLLPVEARLNRQKGDKGPEAWLPPRRAYRSTYAVRWITIKHEYGLTITAAEKKTLERLLQG
jgi:hypothetical protein